MEGETDSGKDYLKNELSEKRTDEMELRGINGKMEHD